ncbi:MAG TPA: DUF6503 family protein [Chitinophagaceae bacterium]|nr:DUF6503 family protein [Chitinophagaceae bacterium]
MYKKFPVVTAIILFMVAFSCKQKNAGETDSGKLPVSMDDSSRIIIDRAIAYAGGYDAWLQKKTLSFDKKSTSYDSTGKVIRETDMHLDYMMKPEFRAKLTYKLHDTDIVLIHDGKKAAKFYNGKLSKEQKDIDGAWNSCFGSEYVMCMPYKLKDPGIKAEYIGQVSLADGVPAQLIKTSYSKGAGSNPSHIWYYYFEPGTGKLLANSFNGKNNYWDYTQYEQFEKASGLLLPSIRKGYTADTLNNQGILISESRHSNIGFDKEFPQDHFKIVDGK